MEFHRNIAILVMLMGASVQTLVALALLHYNKSLPWRPQKNIISYLNNLLIGSVCLYSNSMVIFYIT